MLLLHATARSAISWNSEARGSARCSARAGVHRARCSSGVGHSACPATATSTPASGARPLSIPRGFRVPRARHPVQGSNGAIEALALSRSRHEISARLVVIGPEDMRIRRRDAAARRAVSAWRRTSTGAGILAPEQAVAESPRAGARADRPVCLGRAVSAGHDRDGRCARAASWPRMSAGSPRGCTTRSTRCCSPVAMPAAAAAAPRGCFRASASRPLLAAERARTRARRHFASGPTSTIRRAS